MVRPQDFTTKPKHRTDRGKINEGVYSTDPTPFLPNVVTGQKLDHSVLGIVTTGQMPSGLNAHVRENGVVNACEFIVFVWPSRRHFPGSDLYIHDRLLPNSNPVW